MIRFFVLLFVLFSFFSCKDNDSVSIKDNDLKGKSYKAFFFKSPVSGRNIYHVMDFISNDKVLTYTLENDDKDFSSEETLNYSLNYPEVIIGKGVYDVDEKFSEIRQQFGYKINYKRFK